jgi:hypothetical protein
MPEQAPRPTGHSDAAKRCSDIVTLHAICGQVGRWVAIKLADGDSDGVVYDHRADAVRHQLHEQLCAYVQIQPGGMQPCEAEVFLKYHRALYDAGFRLPDPEFAQPLMPLTRRDARQQIRVLAKGPR